ncbi:Alanine--tRNA ligase [Botrimarina colliarenosi]|uniref:Alanine--tRNA ligase n=1 Tax=Botrimarina colliarenosi TaxID=2528001 RepID=A0A5C6ABL3_9BACT|nr:alanine--tRNA ligase [Botrimarina colliarenosi]TWT96979.1 Alanine--tRNA ligase [Botrimarina colliarenosi]
MKTDELREKYLAFYESKGHTRVASDVLVPTWDPSVLFTPAGMNQFKDHFLGKVKLDYTRATTCQKCLRTGDIDNVGRTPRHHTFFEMLGNFSFGDYFKRDAIHWAWEFLTDKKWLGLPAAQLSVTVYKDDKEAADIWNREIGLPMSRISFEEEDENFWPASAPSQGPDGVCGPCSEIYYTAPLAEGGPPHKGRWAEPLEIWNLVFTQFNRVGDPPNNLQPLPSKNIDTGMGLERTAAVLQGVPTNYHIDSLMPLVQAAAEVCGVKYELNSEDGRRLRRISDHVRACTFAVHENVYPGPNKEKYVVKRLLRRAVLDGHQMGVHDPFLYKLVPTVAELMKAAYPDLAETTQRVASVIEKEESNFFGTIDGGLNRIGRVFDEIRKDNRTAVDGVVAAELYQTYGVPPELFESLAAEQHLAFDWDGYRRAMAEHAEDSGKLVHTVMGAKGPIDSLKQALDATEFVGYGTTEATAKIVGVVTGAGGNQQLAESLQQGEAAVLVLDSTPFYGESGGQVGDTGTLTGEGFVFSVTDTQKDGSLFLHRGVLLKGSLDTGDDVIAKVNEDRRDAIRRAHSATHLLHWALQKTLGSHAQQQGSKVDADWLRFDFTNLSAVEPEQLATIAADVEACVAAAGAVKCETLPLADARQAGAMMLFGEKYPDPVRMVSMGPLASGDAFSRELCGGTHLTNTGEVGVFELVAEEGVSAGTRRITAVTGERAKANRQEVVAALAETARTLGVAEETVVEAVGRLLARQRALKKKISGGGAAKAEQAQIRGAKLESYAQRRAALADAARQLSVAPTEVAPRCAALMAEIEKLEAQVKQRDAAGPLDADTLLAKAEVIDGVTVLIAETPGVAAPLMRQLIDAVRQKTSSAAVLLASAEGDDKVTLIAGITKDLQDRGLSAGKWIGPVAKAVGGGGGGRPDLAQAGGKDPSKIAEAIATARETIVPMLGA